MRWLLVLFLALALIVAAVACGGEEEGEGTATASPTTTAEASPLATAEATPEATLTPEPTPTPTPEPVTFDDPFSYCGAVGTIDAPDDRWAGPDIPDQIRDRLPELFGQPHLAEAGFFWRCLDGQVWWCYIGANLPCGKANTSRQPTPEMEEFCQENPDLGMPFAATGHDTIYAWECRAGVPTITGQIASVDPRGFIADFWNQIQP